MNRNNFLAIGFVILLLAIAANTIISVKASERASNTGHLTCQIQDRGLHAGPHLTRAMQDIGTLLTPFPGEKQASIPEPLIAPLTNLREELGAYVTIEHEQPVARSCQ